MTWSPHRPVSLLCVRVVHHSPKVLHLLPVGQIRTCSLLLYSQHLGIRGNGLGRKTALTGLYAVLFSVCLCPCSSWQRRHSCAPWSWSGNEWRERLIECQRVTADPDWRDGLGPGCEDDDIPPFSQPGSRRPSAGHLWTSNGRVAGLVPDAHVPGRCLRVSLGVSRIGHCTTKSLYGLSEGQGRLEEMKVTIVGHAGVKVDIFQLSKYCALPLTTYLTTTHVTLLPEYRTLYLTNLGGVQTSLPMGPVKARPIPAALSFFERY